MPAHYKPDDDSNLKFYSLLIIMLLIVCGLIYAIYFTGGIRRSSSSSSEDGLTFGPKNKKPSGVKDGAASSTNADDGLDALFLGQRKTPGRNKFSHVAAVRSLSSFCWDNTAYYEETIKPLEPMAKSSFDEFYDRQIKPMAEMANLNPAVSAQVDQAEKHPLYLEAVAYFNKGRYKEAVEIFANLADKSTNIYLKSISLGYLVEIYKSAGDDEQEKKAQAALILNNAKLYFKAFPGTEKYMTAGQPAETKDVIKRLLSEKSKINFKAPKKSSNF